MYDRHLRHSARLSGCLSENGRNGTFKQDKA